MKYEDSLRYKKKYKKFLQELFNSQKGKCAICRKEDDNLEIDCNYQNGKVRGLLCSNCKTGLGQFFYNVELMLNAISYIRIKKY